MKRINFGNQEAVFAKRPKLQSFVIGEGYVAPLFGFCLY